MRMIPCPKLTRFGDSTHAHDQNMLLLCTERYLRRVHVQCVDVAIRRIAYVWGHCLETHVHSTSSDTDAVDRQEVLRETSPGIVATLVR
jgi:hypothetical protein